MNPLISTDSYKCSHYKQYPPDTQRVFSYFESRGGDTEHICAFGAWEYLLKGLSKPITVADIKEAQELFQGHFTENLFNRAGWEHILNKHGGYLPVRIRIVPEGTNVPLHNALFTIENTDPEVPWLTNYLETRLCQVWYPMTVATYSQKCRRLILKYLRVTGTPEQIDFKLHDFGYRGTSSEESAIIGGMAHLVNFKGSDTLPAVAAIPRYYITPIPGAGFSIPASEHSTITSWGRMYERDAYQNMLTSYPSGMVACVSDSYNIYHACDVLWGQVLRDQVIARQGILVIRLDSGDPVQVVLKALSILSNRFGSELNEKGYRVLNPAVRILQGDGVNYERINQILLAMALAGWSADNIAFGMGGALLQNLTRDTYSFALKCSAAQVNGEWRDVCKSPIDAPEKRSKTGRLDLVKVNDQFLTIAREICNEPSELVTAFEGGSIVMPPESWETIRERARDGE